jgi:hypothetical protein
VRGWTWGRGLLGGCAAIAAVAVVLAGYEELGLRSLLQGVPQGYRLVDVALVAAASATCWLCVVAAQRSVRPGWDPLLLTGPVVLLALGLEVLTTPVYDDAFFSYSEVVPVEGFPSLPVDLLLLACGVLAGAGLPTWALLRSRRPGTTGPGAPPGPEP